MQVQTEKKTRNAAEIRCKIGLLIFLLLGAALILVGIRQVTKPDKKAAD